jgi:hypothetical protein
MRLDDAYALVKQIALAVEIDVEVKGEPSPQWVLQSLCCSSGF